MARSCRYFDILSRNNLPTSGRRLGRRATVSRKLLAKLAPDSRGLVAAIAQDAASGEVLMLGWMSRESLAITLATGKVTYYSRSRKKLWEKGKTSGNTQTLRSVRLDCDGDALLLQVDQRGPACHTGARSCFFTDIEIAAGISDADED